MATYTDITHWYVLEWVTTTGTREKCFVENPINGKRYFFKESIEKFPDEYWSEIISSKVGISLGFNVLEYNIGRHFDVFGCICESMIDQSNQELEHGINLIKKAIPGFRLSERPLISFVQIETALSRYNQHFVNKFIEVMVFDAMIGNQDRHSENWAIVRSLDMTNRAQNLGRLTRFLYNNYKKSNLNLKNLPFKKYFISVMSNSQLINYEFSKIYDSGSSLGRELDAERMSLFIKDQNELLKYINKGKSEILWEGKRTSHFELLKSIKIKHETMLKRVIEQVLEKWNEEIIKNIINDIDIEIPAQYAQNKLSLQRKELIFLLIKNRISILRQIIQ